MNESTPNRASFGEATAAVVQERGGAFRLEPVVVASPGAGEVLVRVMASGICQTDVHGRDGFFPLSFPAVFGHEGAGIVEAIGAGVKKVEPGDKVVMVFPSCGTCAYCLSGKPSYCREAFRLKFSGTLADGSTALSRGGTPLSGAFFQQSSFATLALATERNVVKIPEEDVPVDLLAAFPCGVNTGAGAVLNVLSPGVGDSIAVFGTGTVGLAGVMAARVAGCDPIIAVDVRPGRLEFARSLGATHTIDASVSDPVAGIRSLTDGLGVHRALEAAGSPQACAQALDSLRPLGVCCLVGSSRAGTTAAIDMNRLQNGRTLRGCIQGDSVPDRFLPRLIELYRAGRLPVERLVTFYDFADINRAVADSIAGQTIKPLLRMQP